MAQHKTHVSEAKKTKVKELSENMKKKTVMIISIKGLPSAQFQDIKKKLRDKAKIVVAKTSLIHHALDKCGIKELHELAKHVTDSTAILFSNEDAFEIAAILSDNKSPAKAKPGQVATEDIEIKAGPTSLMPGPDISALSAVGLTPKVEGGKIAILKDKVLVKKGSTISGNIAAILAKLEVVPFEVGIDPVAAYMNEKVYSNIKVDKEATIKSLEDAYSRSLPFAVEIAYVNNQTIDFILGKASLHEKAILSLISETKSQEIVS
jgi:large subunit ribosomal protein L10